MAFVLDPQAIQAAADFLGLEHPVHVQVRRGVHSWLGIYRGLLFQPSGARTTRWSEPRHVIGLNGGMDPEQASRTLWHEMAHALQCERDYDGNWRLFFREYSDAMRAVGAKSMAARQGAGHKRYKAVHFEHEADEYACLAETDPLARARTYP